MILKLEFGLRTRELEPSLSCFQAIWASISLAVSSISISVTNSYCTLLGKSARIIFILVMAKTMPGNFVDQHQRECSPCCWGVSLRLTTKKAESPSTSPYNCQYESSRCFRAAMLSLSPKIHPVDMSRIYCSSVSVAAKIKSDALSITSALDRVRWLTAAPSFVVVSIVSALFPHTTSSILANNSPPTVDPSLWRTSFSRLILFSIACTEDGFPGIPRLLPVAVTVCLCCGGGISAKKTGSHRENRYKIKTDGKNG